MDITKSKLAVASMSTLTHTYSYLYHVSGGRQEHLPPPFNLIKYSRTMFNKDEPDDTSNTVSGRKSIFV